MPLPDKIKNRPELTMGLEMYWRAFWECSSDRNYGMAEGPIPWSSMDRWARRYDLEGEDYERFVLILKAMDSAYIGHKTPKNSKVGGKSGKSFKKPPLGGK